MKLFSIFVLLVSQLPGQTGVDLSMPQSPAVTVLGLAPGVIQPGTPREFTAAVLNGNGLSTDFVPYWLAAGQLVDREIYKANPIVRLLAGTQVSLATVNSRLAGGVLVRIFDKGDPRLDDVLADCLQKAAERALAQSAPLAPGADVDRENTRRESLLKNTCRDQAAKRNWNRSSLVVAAGKENGVAAVDAWSSLAYGFEGVPGLESTSQLIVQFSRRGRQNLGSWTFKAGTPNTHVSLAWMASQLSIGAERKIADNLWLQLSVGGTSLNQLSVLSALHWGLAKQ
jgi:hypothetical protein